MSSLTSDVHIATTSQRSTSATAKTGPGVLSLGVDVGVVGLPASAVEPDVVPAATEPRPDRLERTDHNRSMRETELREPQTATPFDDVKRDSRRLEERRLSDSPVGMGEELDPSLAVAAKLSELERQLGAEHARRFQNTRLGMMLLTADGQAARAGRVPIPESAIESLARQILVKGNAFGDEDHTAFLKLHSRFHAAIDKNIQAYVQRVLRECYLIQNQLLMDYAAKVRHFNDLKSKTRDILEQARAAKTAWGAEAKGKEGFIADPPFAWLEVDDEGTVYTPTMTAQDVERWKAETAAAAALSEGASGAANAGFEVTYGESQLTANDIDTLEMLKKNKDRSFWDKVGLDFNPDTDNYIEDHMAELLSLIPKMNKSDLVSHLAPIIAILSGGNANERALLQIFGALSPSQFLCVMSGAEDFAAHQCAQGVGTGIGAITGTAGGGVVNLGLLSMPLAKVGASLGDFFGRIFGRGLFNAGEQAELDLLGQRAARAVAAAAGESFDGQLTLQKAAELLAALNAKQSGARLGGEIDEPGIGSPKEIRTMQGMEDYIKIMEEKLNSIGDDAQLANVDLQNALQQQQQTLQMLTNISKVLHDTALAIVRRVGQ